MGHACGRHALSNGPRGSGGLQKIVYVETLRNSRGIEPRVGGRERREVFLNRMGINHFIRRSRSTAFKRRGPQSTATDRTYIMMNNRENGIDVHCGIILCQAGTTRCSMLPISAFPLTTSRVRDSFAWPSEHPDLWRSAAMLLTNGHDV